MNTAEQVKLSIEQWKSEGIPLSDVAWKTALACVGWAYVFGARGEECTPSVRRARYSDAHPTIKSKCKNFDGQNTCSGCKWYPSGKRTRCFDCRGFTYWVLLQVYGWKLMGTGATSQWNNEDNWTAKGTIDTMPKDTLCCLFKANGKTKEHTGFGLNNETVECSNGVQYFSTRNKKWTHWGVPKCVESGEIPTPTPTPTPVPDRKPTLRRGSKGEYVTLLQTQLINRGYDLGKCGVDGDFGRATESAVKAFQRDYGLTADGVVGEKTWQALDSSEPMKFYTVTIPHLSFIHADALVKQYGNGSSMKLEG